MIIFLYLRTRLFVKRSSFFCTLKVAFTVTISSLNSCSYLNCLSLNYLNISPSALFWIYCSLCLCSALISKILVFKFLSLSSRRLIYSVIYLPRGVFSICRNLMSQYFIRASSQNIFSSSNFCGIGRLSSKNQNSAPTTPLIVLAWFLSVSIAEASFRIRSPTEYYK